MRFIFLAAGKGKRIFSKIKKNKSLIIVHKLPLIKLLINEVKKTDINKISIVVGYRSSYIKRDNTFISKKKTKLKINKNCITILTVGDLIKCVSEIIPSINIKIKNINKFKS